MLSAACGADCNGCEFKAACHGGYFASEGKVCYLAELGLEQCEVYNCAINKKGYKSCAECAELPCELFLGWRDPKLTDEEWKKNVEKRIANLKASL